jgi:hypothetical protein
MSKNIIFVLMYHRHKLFDLIYEVGELINIFQVLWT